MTLGGTFAILLLAAAAVWSGAALGQEARTSTEYDVVAPPPCTNYKGETVGFIDRRSGRPRFAAGMAVRDGGGKPVVLRSNYAAAPPEFQRFIDRHECAHHQTGDVDRPHPPRNGPEHLMNESVSDCVAILRMRDEDGMDADAFRAVTSALRDSMQGVGFPEISISSRISNITNCFENHAGAGQLIEHVLEHRGLN